MEEIVKADPAIEWVLTVPGYSILDGAIEPNAAFVLGRLKPFEERTTPDLKVDAVIQRVAALSAGIPSARVIPFNLPPALGLAVLFAYLFLVGLYYPGSRAAGYCFGRGRGQSEGRGDRGVRRNAGGVHSRSVPDPDALCGVPTAAGVVSRLSGPSKIRAGSNCRFGRITPEFQIESVSLCSQRCLTSPCSIIRPASASAIPAWIASICQKLSFRNSSIARSARYDLERSVAMAHASSAALASSDIRRVMVDMG